MKYVTYKISILGAILFFSVTSCSDQSRTDDFMNDYRQEKLCLINIVSIEKIRDKYEILNLKEIKLGQPAPGYCNICNDISSLTENRLLSKPTAFTGNALNYYRNNFNNSGAGLEKENCDQLKIGNKKHIVSFENKTAEFCKDDYLQGKIDIMPFNIRTYYDHTINHTLNNK